VGVKRGDLVTVALQGAYGKPCPALVIQSNLFTEHPSVTVLPLTSEFVDAPLVRIRIEPSAENGLQKPSQIMVDKTSTLPRTKISGPFGYVDDGTMLAVTRALTVFLGFA
jgi:mRNA interferase MazF